MVIGSKVYISSDINKYTGRVIMIVEKKAYISWPAGYKSWHGFNELVIVD